MIGPYFVQIQACKLRRGCRTQLYTNVVDNFGKVYTFLPVQKQTDGYNCGPFSIAYAAEILDGKSPMDACFDVKKMRSHLISW